MNIIISFLSSLTIDFLAFEIIYNAFISLHILLIVYHTYFLSSSQHVLLLNLFSFFFLNCIPSVDIVLSMPSLPSLVIIDSVQTLRTAACSNGMGSVTQIRESTSRFVELAKTSGTVGHTDTFVCAYGSAYIHIYIQAIIHTHARSFTRTHRSRHTHTQPHTRTHVPTITL